MPKSYAIVFRDPQITENYVIGALDAVSLKPLYIEGNRAVAEGLWEDARKLEGLPGIVSVEETTADKVMTSRA